MMRTHNHNHIVLPAPPCMLLLLTSKHVGTPAPQWCPTDSPGANLVEVWKEASFKVVLGVLTDFGMQEAVLGPRYFAVLPYVN